MKRVLNAIAWIIALLGYLIIGAVILLIVLLMVTGLYKEWNEVGAYTFFVRGGTAIGILFFIFALFFLWSWAVDKTFKAKAK